MNQKKEKSWKYYSNVRHTIGRTPWCGSKSDGRGAHASIFAKLEYFNPLGSVKDRIAAAMTRQRKKPADSIPKP
ncbi:MAG: hypothetical protein R2861_09435 [Desulfobacterales bacterium]